MIYKIEECPYSCPLFDSEYFSCQHPTYPNKEAQYIPKKEFCPLREEPLILTADFK